MALLFESLELRLDLLLRLVQLEGDGVIGLAIGDCCGSRRSIGLSRLDCVTSCLLFISMIRFVVTRPDGLWLTELVDSVDLMFICCGGDLPSFRSISSDFSGFFINGGGFFLSGSTLDGDESDLSPFSSPPCAVNTLNAFSVLATLDGLLTGSGNSNILKNRPQSGKNKANLDYSYHPESRSR